MLEFAREVYVTGISELLIAIGWTAVFAVCSRPTQANSRLWTSWFSPTPSSRSREGSSTGPSPRPTPTAAQPLLVELDTPGGLLDSTRTMVGAILGSRVPVIVYVCAGGRARRLGGLLSAGVGRHRRHGSRHQRRSGSSGDRRSAISPTRLMSQKIENDAEAFLRSYVTETRTANAEAAEAAVHSSHSYTAQEALDQHLIDLTAPNEWQLLGALDGREITRIDGTKLTLHLAERRALKLLRPTLREELLGWLVNPNIALLLLVGGALLIYLEFNAPGTIVPGALGTLMVLLAIFALNLLPIRYTAVLLLVAAMVLLLLEAKFGGHGALAIAGIVCLTFGTLTLVAAPGAGDGRQPLGGHRGQRGLRAASPSSSSDWRCARADMKSRLGADALVGSCASAMEPLTPEGHVLVEGEIWRAVSSEPVSAGTPLRVVGHEQYLLHVEPVRRPRPPQSARKPCWSTIRL